MKKCILVAGFSGMAGIVAGVMLQKRKSSKLTGTYRAMASKNMDILTLFNQWIILKHKNVHFAEYFDKYQYQSIAIYGMSFVGQRLMDELKDSSVEIRYVVDKNASYVHSDLQVFRPEDDLPPVDAIIITPLTFYKEIKEQLEHKVNCPLISIEDLMYEL